MFLEMANLLATATTFQRVFEPINDLIQLLLPFLIALVASLGSIWCIVLGVKYARAEEQQERDKAKGALKNAIIGFVMIFVLLATLHFATPALSDWMGTMTEGSL